MMKTTRVIAMFLSVVLFLVGCGNKAPESDTSVLIREGKERFIDYYEENKDLLRQIAEELLEIHNTVPSQTGIQHYVGNEYLDFFYGEDWNRVALSDYKQAAQLINQLTEDDTPIKLIYATDRGYTFSGKTCEFHYSLIEDNVYYSLSLCYCEDPNAEAMLPEVSTKLDDHWYFVGHDLE